MSRKSKGGGLWLALGFGVVGVALAVILKPKQQ